MKKVLSLLMAVIMLCTLTAGIDFSAYAAGWVDYAENIQLNTVYNESASTADYCVKENVHGVRYYYYYDSFKFDVPLNGVITLNIESADEDYVPFDEFTRIDYYIYDANNLNNKVWSSNDSYPIASGYSSGRNVNYAKFQCGLSAGEYYLVAGYWHTVSTSLKQEGTYDSSLTYQPSLSTPSNLKVASRGESNLTLSWGSVGNASGYVL